MVKLENKEFKDGEVTRFLGKNYAGACISMLENEPAKGMNIGEMRKRSKIIDKIEAVKNDSIIELEDSEAKKIKDIVDNYPFASVKKELIEFSDALEAK